MSVLPPGFDPAITPIFPPPPGVVSNFDNPQSRTPALDTATAFISTFVVLFTCARLSAKFAFARSQLGIEDVFCVLGTALSLAYAGIGMWLFHLGLGRHGWDTRLVEAIEHLNQLTNGARAINIVYGVAMVFTKLSILCLYFRLFQVSHRARIWIHVGIVGTILTHIIGTILFSINGSPKTPKDNMRYVNRLSTIQLGVSAANLVGDFYVLLLPVMEVWRLQLNRCRKIGVLAIFCTGLFACVAGTGL
ncbi:MAG: hypothetical protein Q9219_005540 [cf. Caloplaca sp. 3 TL-2023]